MPLLLPLTQRLVALLSILQRHGNNPVLTITQAPAIGLIMISRCIGTITDIDHRGGASGAIEKQQNEQK